MSPRYRRSISIPCPRGLTLDDPPQKPVLLGHRQVSHPVGEFAGFVGDLLERRRSLGGDREQDDLTILKELVEAGRVAPVIDQTYPLRDTAEAFRNVDGGHARGKVVVTVEDDG